MPNTPPEKPDANKNRKESDLSSPDIKRGWDRSGHSDSEKNRWFQDNVLGHQKSLFGYLRKLLGSETEAQDVAQDVYLKMYKLSNYNEIEAPRAFLLRTAHNTVMQRFRREKIISMETVADFDDLSIYNNTPDISEQVESQKRFAMLSEAIDQLPPVCRQIFIMRKVNGLSQKEIASKLGISESTVEKHAVKGMRRCREYLRERETPNRSDKRGAES